MFKIVLIVLAAVVVVFAPVVARTCSWAASIRWPRAQGTRDLLDNLDAHLRGK